MLNERYLKCRDDLESRGQTHILNCWNSLNNDSRCHLIDQIESICWATVDPLIQSHVLSKPADDVLGNLQPAVVHRRTPAKGEAEKYQRALSVGKELLSSGKVAAFTVAGGQGTRLGFDGPKGAITISPVREKTLFQLFAEIISATRERYQTAIPWYIMTNPGNHQQTVEFLKDHSYFGLPTNDVILFSQGMLPSFDFLGKLLMMDKHHLALSPDGHGGSLKALATSNALLDMKQRGIEIVSYFQVDNPLVQPFDELFLGLHRITESEMSTKVAPKVDDLERVGNICLSDGKVVVVEYSNFPEELASEKNSDGTRKFAIGNLAIHLLDVDFIDRIVAHEFQLPYHRAEKTVTYMDENGFQRTPPSQATNAVKLETFVFDALPLARNPLLLEIDRKEEFSPVKNAKGTDSIETAIRDQIHRAARWLAEAGVTIPRNSANEPDVIVEIASSYALNAQDVRDKVASPPPLHPGETIYFS